MMKTQGCFLGSLRTRRKTPCFDLTQASNCSSVFVLFRVFAGSSCRRFYRPQVVVCCLPEPHLSPHLALDTQLPVGRRASSRLLFHSLALGYVDVHFSRFFIVALWALDAKRLTLVGICFSLACLTKWQPLILAPFVLLRLATGRRSSNCVTKAPSGNASSPTCHSENIRIRPPSELRLPRRILKIERGGEFFGIVEPLTAGTFPTGKRRSASGFGRLTCSTPAFEALTESRANLKTQSSACSSVDLDPEERECRCKGP
jgi:hypothetical protein